MKNEGKNELWKRQHTKNDVISKYLEVKREAVDREGWRAMNTCHKLAAQQTTKGRRNRIRTRRNRIVIHIFVSFCLWAVEQQDTD